MRFIIALLVSFGMLLNAYAQDSRTYTSRDGKLGISIYYVDTLLTVGSSKLKVTIDNETMDILIMVKPKTLKTGIDSLDRKLSEGIHRDIVFKGQINLNQIQTKGRPVQKFDVTGTLTINERTKNITMQGRLQHYEEGPGIESLLYLHYDIELTDFGLDEKLLGFANNGCIEMLQGLLIPTSK